MIEKDSVLGHVIVSAENYSIDSLIEDIKWSNEEDIERQRWHKARYSEMNRMEIVQWKGLNLRVSNGVFRPYLDSCPLANTTLNIIKDDMNILDIGGGSGNIAILAALERKNAIVTSVDTNPEAVRTIKINAGHYRVEDRLRAYESNIFSSLKVKDLVPYDLIIGNLPFMDTEVNECNYVKRAICDPHLYGYRNLFHYAKNYLKKGSTIYLAYSNFAPLKELISVAYSYGYRCEVVDFLKMNIIENKKERLGLRENYREL